MRDKCLMICCWRRHDCPAPLPNARQVFDVLFTRTWPRCAFAKAGSRWELLLLHGPLLRYATSGSLGRLMLASYSSIALILSWKEGESGSPNAEHRLGNISKVECDPIELSVAILPLSEGISCAALNRTMWSKRLTNSVRRRESNVLIIRINYLCLIGIMYYLLYEW